MDDRIALECGRLENRAVVMVMLCGQEEGSHPKKSVLREEKKVSVYCGPTIFHAIYLPNMTVNIHFMAW